MLAYLMFGMFSGFVAGLLCVIFSAPILIVILAYSIVGCCSVLLLMLLSEIKRQLF
jgi:hypothetical protein